MTEETLGSELQRASAGVGRQPGPRRPRSELRWRLAKPAILDVRFGSLLSIYGWRLRRHGVEELLAGMGIAIGVALLFGVLVAGQSITGSTSKVLHDIVGSARLQLAARSPNGFDERLAERVGKLPGVRVASPLLQAHAVIAGPLARQSVQLVGATPSLLDLKGAATRELRATNLGGGVALTTSLAGQIGGKANGSITLIARGRAYRLPVRAVWGEHQVGSMANSPIVLSALPVAQHVLILPARITHVLIEPRPGSEHRVISELGALAAGRLDVQSAEHELAVLKVTAQPTNQSLKLFAAIGAIVGLLFAVNAMLLTVPARRRWVAEARMQGYGTGQVVLVLAFQAVALGIVASILGVLLGDVLAHALFTALPIYLTLQFPIGTQPVISTSTIALGIGAGVVAALVVSAAPLRDLAPGRPIDAILHTTGKVGRSVGTTTTLWSAFVGGGLIVAATLLAGFAPSLGIGASVLLAFAAVSLVPGLLVAVVRALIPIGERIHRSMLAIALMEVEGTATRSIALACVAALAIYGSAAVAGARSDLVRGLHSATVDFFSPAAIWITPTGNNPYLTESFTANTLSTIARTPEIASVRSYDNAFLDVGSRRLWVRARPPSDSSLIQGSQLLHGDLARATARIRSGGWAAVSSGFASEHHLALADSFTLPTPSGAMPLRVAAMTTNAGWPPGAITINTRDYERGWQTNNPTALGANVKSGVSPPEGNRAVVQALGRQRGLEVQTRAEVESLHQRDLQQGIRSLGEILALMLIAAGLAITFALAATISARRIDLAARKADGYRASQLWAMLLLESTVVLGVGALVGAILGFYGHVIAGRWLRLGLGFPAPFSADIPQLLLTLAIGAVIALTVAGLVAFVAVRVPPRLSPEE